MGENSKIEWTHSTFNPVRGCQKISEGCANCYAETISKRNPEVLGEWGPSGVRAVAAESYWNLPVKWNKQAARAGEQQRVFCASLSDWLEDHPEWRAPRARLLRVIWETPHLDWLLLSKRPEHFVKLVRDAALNLEGQGEKDLAQEIIAWTFGGLIQPNIWIGTSIENQETADKRIPELLKIPARIRFLSVEPLLGPIDLRAIYRPQDGGNWDTLRGIDTGLGCHLTGKIHWVIVGGESGPRARPMRADWLVALREQCRAAGVPIFIKQLGNQLAKQSEFRDPKGGDMNEWPAEYRVRQFP